MEILTYTIVWLALGSLFAIFLLSNDPYLKARRFARSTAEQIEILKHKWLESEKAGYDIGFESAQKSWDKNHAQNWRRSKRKAA